MVLVDGYGLDRDEAVLVCTAILDILAERARWATVDAWSDYRAELPAAVERAQEGLRRLNRERDGRDEAMAVLIDRDDPEQEVMLRDYAAWSIHVELLLARDGRPTATLHDGASGIDADLTGPEVEDLRGRLPARVSLRTSTEVRAERKTERRAARRARWTDRRDRWAGRPGAR